MTTYILNVELLNGVALARGVKEPNDKLNQVYVWDDDAKRNYMATNGHILFWARADRTGGEKKIKGKLALFWEGKIKHKKHELGVALHTDETGLGTIRTVAEDKRCEVSTIEPPENWLRCIPARDSEKLTVYRAFNPQYLGYVREFIGWSYFKRPQTRTNDEDLSPVVWYTEEDKVACIMPIRLERGE
ncbi:hypothetical protein J6S46_02940 [Candidatus Saccharibacteria bacterium]|nr:hypothetical protein [Candidatus Saccharibacteria bacterium]